MTAIETLETEQVRGWYDEEQRILFVVYRGLLSPDVTAQVYRWLGNMIQTNPVEAAKAVGSIYDFRQVTGFDSRNLTSAQRQSQQLNTKADLSSHPVALIVQSMMQEQMLKVELKISPQQTRKRIVRSDAEALAFINSFRPERGPIDKLQA
jgi:hypothetical protein